MVSGDKDSCVVIMKTDDYIRKLNGMVNDGISKNIYKTCDDTIREDLTSFQNFLHNHFRTHKQYNEMYPRSNQPARLYATAKTHKFDSIEAVNIDELKFRPIMDNTGTMTYQTAKVISSYLSSLCNNEYVLKDACEFAKIFESLPALNEGEQYVSYDVESLFTNVPVNDVIDYIMNQVYVKQKLPIICKKPFIFRRLLVRLTTGNIFSFNNILYKQIDGGPSFSDTGRYTYG